MTWLYEAYGYLTPVFSEKNLIMSRKRAVVILPSFVWCG